MSGDANMVVGPYEIASTGPLTLQSQGAGVQIRSLMGDDGLQLQAETNVTVTAQPAMLILSKEGQVYLTPGKTGKLVQTVGPPLVGSLIQMEPTSIKMSVGPPMVGASITLGPDAITLQIGTTSLKLTALGITEEVAAVTTRKAGPEGHTLQSVETSVKVTPAGVLTNAPMTKANVDGVAMVQAGIEQTTVQGIRREQAGIRMAQ
jgi:hypothetical protein